MGGILYFVGEKPAVGTRVMITVDGANSPTGIWDGELVEVGDGADKAINPATDLPGTLWTQCKAKITDPRDISGYQGREPHLNYQVYVESVGGYYLRHRLVDAKTEIRGLKNHLEIERGVWHAALKAMVSSEAMTRLEKILSDFLAKLNR